jgi:hypothetical protein
MVDKGLTKNLLKNHVCGNCRHFEESEIDWCSEQNNRPKYDTCSKWRAMLNVNALRPWGASLNSKGPGSYARRRGRKRR